jgi:hypothetical protein
MRVRADNRQAQVDNRMGCNKYSAACNDDGDDDNHDGGDGLFQLQPPREQLKQHSTTFQIILLLACLFYSISKSKLTFSASPCRIISTVCGSPSRHFDLEMELVLVFMLNLVHYHFVYQNFF